MTISISSVILAALAYDEPTDWKDLVSFRPPVILQQEVSSKGTYPDNWYFHRIEDAASENLNLDNYPIYVKTLPTIDGQLMSPAAFVKYVRMNLNSIVDTSYAKFAPYDEAGQEAKWNSNNPLGAVLSIKLWPNVTDISPDDGSVMVTATTDLSWTFSTLWTTKDKGHPVSGNRQFGLKRASDGNWFFFTRGADRPTSCTDGLLGGKLAFFFGVKLWRSLQTGIVKLVNDHAGQAEVSPATSTRVRWADVKSLHTPTGAWTEFLLTGKWDSDDDAMRFSLELDGTNGKWTERSPTGAVLTRDVTVRQIDGQLRIYRENDDQTVKFLFREPLRAQILMLNPHSSYLVLSRDGEAVTGKWFGLKASTNGDVVTGISQPEVQPGTVFTFSRQI